MADIFRTMIVTAEHQALAQHIATSIKPVAGSGMWETPLAAVASGVPTHYISTGFISPEWQPLMPLQTWELQGDPEAWVQTDSFPGDAAQLKAVLDSVSAGVTLDQINALFADTDVTEQNPFVAMGRMGLVIAEQTDLLEE